MGSQDSFGVNICYDDCTDNTLQLKIDTVYFGSLSIFKSAYKASYNSRIFWIIPANIDTLPLSLIIQFVNYSSMVNKTYADLISSWDTTVIYLIPLPNVFTPPPSISPTISPTIHPTIFTPTIIPTLNPTLMPTLSPTLIPTSYPTTTQLPTKNPTLEPTFIPTSSPTISPTINPTFYPTNIPSFPPTFYPTNKTSMIYPSIQPSIELKCVFFHFQSILFVHF